VKQYRLEAEPAVELDIESAFIGTRLRSWDWDANFSTSFAPRTTEFSKTRVRFGIYTLASGAL
jgi:hypothetical protein